MAPAVAVRNNDGLYTHSAVGFGEWLLSKIQISFSLVHEREGIFVTRVSCFKGVTPADFVLRRLESTRAFADRAPAIGKPQAITVIGRSNPKPYTVLRVPKNVPFSFWGEGQRMG